MKKLPIGIQDFRELREKDFIYIDKTQYIYELVSNSKVYFLSRPRRFGKSLLVSTLKELFLGNKALFEGLWIEDKIEWKQHPVIHLSFAKGDYKEVGLRKYLLENIYRTAEEHDITLQNSTLGFALEELIKTLHTKHQAQVVLLIDEYDKPIIDFLGKDEIHIAKEHRDLMKEFYSPIKDLDPHLRFFFLTGVSKFSKVSVFSELNNLDDLTMNQDFAHLVGYTEQEILDNFQEHIENVAQSQGVTAEEVVINMRRWYNGYNFRNPEKVYNPFSVLRFFRERNFNNFWIETGIPTFLTKLLAEGGYYDMREVKADILSLGAFDIENIEPVTVLFQTGFLTLKKHEGLTVYSLDYPNQEVESTMLQLLLKEFSKRTNSEVSTTLIDLKECFEQNQLEKVFIHLNSLFAKIPYHIFEEHLESYYHSIIFLTFTLLGYYAEAEVNTSLGRIDVVVKTKENIYVLEFKVDDSAENALKQIRDKKYYEKYLSEQKKIWLIGIACQEKHLKEYLIEEL